MKGNQRSIRFTAAQMEQLEELANRYSVDVATVVRWSVDALIQHVERHGGRLHLPVNFDEAWEQKNLAAEDPAKYNPGRDKEVG